METKKIYSKAKVPPTSLAICYIEECINEPNHKMYRYWHWDDKNSRYPYRTFINDEANLVNHLMYNKPEYLQQLLDECRLYRYIMKTVRDYDRAVSLKTAELCKEDKEMQLALTIGDMDKYYALEKNNQSRAEEMFRDMIYPV